MAPKLPPWIQELQRDFPELAWEKRAWIAARIDRDVKMWERYLRGEVTPDSDKIQEFRERLEVHRLAEQLIAERRRSKGSLDKSAQIGKGSQPLPSPVKEVHGMEAWREQFKDTVGGMVESEEEARRVQREVMRLLVEWRGTPSPLSETGVK